MTRGSSVSARQMAYILSAAHSGSTLLAMLLGTHPEAFTVGELGGPAIREPNYKCSCGKGIDDCGFWNRVSEEMGRRGISGFDIRNAGTSIHETENSYLRRLLDPLQRGPLLELARDLALNCSPEWRRHLKKVQDQNTAMVNALLELTGAQVLVDSSKSVVHLNYLLRNRALDIKIIWLVRDGRAVSLSLIGHGMKRATPEETVAAAAREWRRSNEAEQILLKRLPRSQWLEVHYETLCREPEKTMRGIYEFLGMKAEALNLDFRSREQHVLGNDGMRMKSTAEIRLDERWRKQFSPEDLSVFDREAGELNRACGYE